MQAALLQLTDFQATMTGSGFGLTVKEEEVAIFYFNTKTTIDNIIRSHTKLWY